MAIDDEKYSVGHGRPPRRTRFKKGESGNPRGRPKGSKNVATVLAEVLNARVPANVNGRRRLITKLYAVMTQLVNKAASGDPRSIQILLNEIRQIQSDRALYPAPPADPVERPHELSAEEKAEWALEVTRILRELGQLDDMLGRVPDVDPSQNSQSLIKRDK